MKRCKVCNQEKSFDFFVKDKRCKEGRKNICKKCHSERQIKYLNRDLCKRIKKNEYNRNRLENNKTEINKRRRERRKKNKDSINLKNRERYFADSEYRRKIIDYSLSYIKKKMKNDPIARMRKNLRRRLNIALKGYKKVDSSIRLVGCSSEELRKYIEKQFKPGMTWWNYGFYGWHIDHIRPCSSFDFSDPEQQKECFNYTNLQPLWWWENFNKRDRITTIP